MCTVGNVGFGLGHRVCPVIICEGKIPLELFSNTGSFVIKQDALSFFKRESDSPVTLKSKVKTHSTTTKWFSQLVGAKS